MLKQMFPSRIMAAVIVNENLVPSFTHTYTIFCRESILYIIITTSNPFVIAFSRVDIGHIHRQHLGNEVRLIERTVRNKEISRALRKTYYICRHTVGKQNIDYHMCANHSLDPT